MRNGFNHIDSRNWGLLRPFLYLMRSYLMHSKDRCFLVLPLPPTLSHRTYSICQLGQEPFTLTVFADASHQGFSAANVHFDCKALDIFKRFNRPKSMSLASVSVLSRSTPHYYYSFPRYWVIAYFFHIT